MVDTLTPWLHPPATKGEGFWSVRRNPKMFRIPRELSLLPAFLVPINTYAQTAPTAGYPEIPREDTLPTLCVPPSSETAEQQTPDSVILLTLPAGTALRLAIDQKVRIAEPGQAGSGKITEAVYAFDQPVIPPGSQVIGPVTSIDPIPRSGKVWR